MDSLLTNYDITKEGGETLTLFRKYTLVSLVFENEANKTKNAPMETPIYHQIVLISHILIYCLGVFTSDNSGRN